MYNVSNHIKPSIKSTIIDYGYKFLYLRPYSPFLNPIGNMFSKWKEYINRGNPKKEQELVNLIKRRKELITADDLQGYF